MLRILKTIAGAAFAVGLLHGSSVLAQSDMQGRWQAEVSGVGIFDIQQDYANEISGTLENNRIYHSFTADWNGYAYDGYMDRYDRYNGNCHVRAHVIFTPISNYETRFEFYGPRRATCDMEANFSQSYYLRRIGR